MCPRAGEGHNEGGVRDPWCAILMPLNCQRLWKGVREEGNVGGECVGCRRVRVRGQCQRPEKRALIETWTVERAGLGGKICLSSK